MADDLDNILDDALDEIDADDDDRQVEEAQECEKASSELQDAVKKAATESAAAAEESVSAASKATEGESLEESMAKLMQDMQDPEFAKGLDEAMKLFSGEGNDKDATKALEGILGDEDAEFSETFKQLAEATKKLESANPEETEKIGEKIMQDMMGQFEKMGMKDDFANTMETMMKQLISKEVMYTPMKQVCEKFPEWLAENESKISKEDFENYTKQNECFQQIVEIYDKDPENYDKVMELMQDMQKYGQPPPEVVKDLAPGVELGENGLPKLDALQGLPGGADGKPPNCPQM